MRETNITTGSAQQRWLRDKKLALETAQLYAKGIYNVGTLTIPGSVSSGLIVRACNSQKQLGNCTHKYCFFAHKQTLSANT